MGVTHTANPRMSDIRPGAIVIGRRDEKTSFTWWAYRVGEPDPKRARHETTHYWIPKEGRWLPAKSGQSYSWCGCIIAVYGDPKEGQDAVDVLQATYDSMWEVRREAENTMRVALKLVTQ